MSSKHNEHEESKGAEDDGFIDQDQVAQVVEAEGDEPMSEDDDEDDDSENNGGDLGSGSQDLEKIEVDMSNNSSGFFDTHQDAIYMIASHPTLPLVVTGGGDDTGYVWSTESMPPTLISKLSGFTESVVAGGFTFDGSYLVAGDMNGQVRVWRAVAGGKQWMFYSSVQEVQEVVSIVFHPKQNIFAVTAIDGSVWCYALEPNLETISVLYGHTMPTNFGLFVDVDNMDALTLITGSDDGTIASWNVYTSTANYKIEPEKQNVLGGALHPWVSVSTSPSGNSYAVGSADGILAIIKTDNGQILKSIDTDAEGTVFEEKSLETICWLSGVNIVAAGNVAGSIFLFEVGTWKLRRTLKLEQAVTKLEAIPGTPYLYSSGHDTSITKWDVRSGSAIWTGKGHSTPVLGFVLQNNGTRVITGDDDGVSLVFDTDVNNQQLVRV